MCSDVNECTEWSESDEPACGPGRVCVNVPGSYHCYDPSDVDCTRLDSDTGQCVLDARVSPAPLCQPGMTFDAAARHCVGKQTGSATSRATAGSEETFSRGPSGEKIFEFFFLMAHSGALYIFEPRRGFSNVAGPGVTYPFTLFLSVGLNKHDALKPSRFLCDFCMKFVRVSRCLAETFGCLTLRAYRCLVRATNSSRRKLVDCSFADV